VNEGRLAEVLAALGEVRWEGDLPELAAQLAAALSPGLRLHALEIGSARGRAARVELERGRVARQDELDADPTLLAARDDVEVVLRRRDGRLGSKRVDEVARRVDARALQILSVRARHVDAYVCCWLAGTRGLDPMEAACVAAVLRPVLAAHVLLGRVAALSRHAHAENVRLRRDLSATLGLASPSASAAMRLAQQRADAVAAYDTTVLLEGPSGSGKEVMARRIHARSGRSEKPFVQINCGALPDALVESELFGHERGAFTGAARQHRGVFERAGDGTILLDEIGDLQKHAQVKLLRVIQERVFTRVGGESELSTRARVVAATNQPLDALVQAGRFREDLYYRLAVFPVRIPSLAERREDIPALARELVRRTAARFGRDAPRIPDETLARLLAHPWPGNVRELGNVIEAALVTSGDELLLPESLPSLRATSSPVLPPAESPEPWRIATRRSIERALAAASGKIYGSGGAAEILQLKPATLQSKMRKLGIHRADFIAPKG
jgi:transcriptional regulator with GAF, ATPase, and Fis domain